MTTKQRSKFVAALASAKEDQKKTIPTYNSLKESLRCANMETQEHLDMLKREEERCNDLEEQLKAALTTAANIAKHRDTLGRYIHVLFTVLGEYLELPEEPSK